MDTDKNLMLDRKVMLSKLEHSKKRCQNEGVIMDSELDRHFRDKRNRFTMK